MKTPAEIRIYEKSMLFYWWPVWAAGFLIGLITYLDGSNFVHASDGATIRISRGSTSGILYISIVIITIFMTSVRMKGFLPVLAIFSAIAVSLLLAWLGAWDNVTGLIPPAKVHLTSGFYFVCSTALLVLWMLVVFGSDRLAYWLIQNNRLTRVRVFGTNGSSEDISKLKLEHQSTDLIRHYIFGFGSGDITIRPESGTRIPVEIQNVLNVQSKLKAIHDMASADRPENNNATTPAEHSPDVHEAGTDVGQISSYTL